MDALCDRCALLQSAYSQRDCADDTAITLEMSAGEKRFRLAGNGKEDRLLRRRTTAERISMMVVRSKTRRDAKLRL